MRMSHRQCTEAGIVIALLLVLVGLFTGTGIYYKIAAAVLFLDLAAPTVFRPFAFCWFNLSLFLGYFTSRVLLSVIFILIIIPVAVIRKLGGTDRLRLKEFKKSTSSVFTKRNIKFGPNNLNQTY
jgi:hypothetical protein